MACSWLFLNGKWQTTVPFVQYAHCRDVVLANSGDRIEAPQDKVADDRGGCAQVGPHAERVEGSMELRQIAETPEETYSRCTSARDTGKR